MAFRGVLPVMRPSRQRLAAAAGAGAAAGALGVAAPAHAAAILPLVSRAPSGPIPAGFDRVAGAGAVAAQAAAVRRFVTPSGVTVRVRAGNAGAATVQSYVDFLDSLPHGSELGLLTLDIRAPAAVRAACGGAQGVLACYSPAANTMVVPGREIAASTGLSTAYVIAHEYGHHVARHRRNDPFSPLDYGPKYWASEQRVCAGVLARRLAPGSEGANYLANPGEAWAESYAQLTYPRVRWRFSSLLAPDPASRQAALRDVRAPWNGDRIRIFRSSLGPGAPSRRFTVILRLDGRFAAALSGPAGADFDLRIAAGGRVRGTTSAPGSTDAIAFRAACRSSAADPVSVTVVRRRGTGPFTLRVRSPG